eukprot:GHVU01048493.1.p4 GENE.GHVU01048493.1~~GHVU01048493.1.p4  ORF type:complete len:115 (+),score=7.22 GHVU01048493.1:1930-2274(+)
MPRDAQRNTFKIATVSHTNTHHMPIRKQHTSVRSFEEALLKILNAFAWVCLSGALPAHLSVCRSSTPSTARNETDQRDTDRDIRRITSWWRIVGWMAATGGTLLRIVSDTHRDI